jgi:hypothetical protein
MDKGILAEVLPSTDLQEDKARTAAIPGGINHSQRSSPNDEILRNHTEFLQSAQPA